MIPLTISIQFELDAKHHGIDSGSDLDHAIRWLIECMIEAMEEDGGITVSDIQHYSRGGETIEINLANGDWL